MCVKELCCLSPIITLYPFHYQLENTEQMALNLSLMFMHMKFLSFWSHIYYLCLWQAIESQLKGILAYLLCFQHQLLPPLENRTGSTEPGRNICKDFVAPALGFWTCSILRTVHLAPGGHCKGVDLFGLRRQNSIK